jgi:diguanylate cyclase (GGDEF)-like protein
MLSLAFAIVFFGMKRTYPNLRGLYSIAISFLLFVTGTFLITSRSSVPYFGSAILANCCVFGSFVFLYRGILLFIGSHKSSFLPILLSFLAVAALYYFSYIQQRVSPRIIAVSLTIGAIRSLIALELFGKSSTSSSPTVMRVFAMFMSLLAAVTISVGLVVIIHGGTHITGLQVSSLQSAALLLSVLSIFTTGLFILLLSSGRLIAASRDESQKDSLSGAFNRRGIEVKLAAELKRVKKGKHKLSVALVDIDYFKSINDIQGHAAGDAALRDVAHALSSHLRKRDCLGRYGGDEFLLILPQTPCSIALGVTERLSRAVSSVAATRGSIPLTLSIGLTEAVPEDDAITLLARADKALYQAKSDGRNCRRVVFAHTCDPLASTGLPATQPLGDILMPPAKSPAVN